MTNWGDAHIRRDLWLRLLQIADDLNGLADEWLAHDSDVREIEDITSYAMEQYELDLHEQRPDSDSETPS